MPYKQLLQQHCRVPHTGLLQLLQQSVQRVQGSGYPGAEVSIPHVIITPHVCSVLMQQRLSVELTQTSIFPKSHILKGIMAAAVCAGFHS
jgi:hypothetical protein